MTSAIGWAKSMGSTYANTVRVFISSTTDMANFRALARSVIHGYQQVCVCEEDFNPHGGLQPLSAIEAEIMKCTAFLCILGENRGTIVRDNKSYVDFEIEYAEKHRIQMHLLAKKFNVFPAFGRGSLADADANGITNLTQLARKYFISTFKDEFDFIRIVSMATCNFRHQAIVDQICQTSSTTEQALRADIAVLEDELKSTRSELALVRKKAAVDSKIRSLAFGAANAVSAVNIGRAAYKVYPKTKSPRELVMEYEAELKPILDSISSNWVDHPLLIELATLSVRKLSDTLKSLTSSTGYSASNYEDLQQLIELLFSSDLTTLRATSIFSEKPGLAVYKHYWSHPKLSIFEERNRSFALNRGKIKRIYICDSVFEFVREDIFQKILGQVTAGAEIKVIDLNHDFAEVYEDFGIYSHGELNAETNYALVAPKGRGKNEEVMTPVLHCKNVSEYVTKFESLWSSSGYEPISYIESLSNSRLDWEGRTRYSVTGLMDGHIILRNMKRLDTGESLATGLHPVPRKSDQEYSKRLSGHIKKSYPEVSTVLYFGDTIENDAFTVRELQKHGHNVIGLICTPHSPPNVILNGICFVKSWDMILQYISYISRRCTFGASTLAIIDLDQTLWAPRDNGIHNYPLRNSRVGAISTILRSYFDDRSSYVRKAVSAASQVYLLTERQEYFDLAQDNEDYKAALAIFIGLGLYKEGFKEGRAETGTIPLFALDSVDEIDHTATGVLKSYVTRKGKTEPQDTAPIQQFVSAARRAVKLAKRNGTAEKYGLKIDDVQRDLEEFEDRLDDRVPAPFKKFRTYEFAATMAIAKEPDVRNALTLNKAVVDTALALKSMGVQLLALSDRPDESTYDSRESLLDIPLPVIGHDVSRELNQVLEALPHPSS